ncbi:AAA family ATPase, partial [Candidatus Wolfebacteria bacterium]|nr:AAA family ATPase [Candidatus Wolfebacteria bacterium]
MEKSFNLADPDERREYFNLKAGKEIKKLKEFLQKNTFVAYLLGKKNSGKGTYAKLFTEALGNEKIVHVSIGDIVRSVHQGLTDGNKKNELMEFLKSNYRGFIPLEKAIETIISRNTKTLLPTELALALIKWEISRMEKKAIFIDGFPRDLDQISYSLYFRDLIGYRDDPDFFVFIDVPEAVINERMKNRVVCPICQTPRSIKLMTTKEVGYDKKKNEFYLICDNPSCKGVRMMAKEGDELGIEAIRQRIEVDEKVMNLLLKLEGIPK